MENPLRHLAIIMDGNRRWAKARGLTEAAGHQAGYEVVKNLADVFVKKGISFLTLFAFSSENWQRSKTEVKFLFKLLERALTKDLDLFHKKGIKLRVIGRRRELDPGIQKLINEAEELTAINTVGVLTLAVNYSGQTEIIEAITKIIQSGVRAEKINAELIKRYLYAPDLPFPDMVLRTSGEKRLSGFLLWQSAYSELLFIDKNWPDFNESDIDFAINEFSKRQRRFGK